MFRLALLLASSIAVSSVASKVGTTRRLEEEDFTWMSGYTLAYGACFYTDNTVAFQLCPEDNSCKKGCNGGAEYLVDLNYFIDSFTEAQMHAREYICEQVRENCDNDDEDQCYEDAGLKYCGEFDEEFNLQEYLECAEFGDDYYVGPYCAEDSYSIYLGFFTDDGCTTHAEEGAFYDLYGYELPYSAESIIDDECARCREHALDEHKDYEDEEDEDDVLEQCEDLYQEATKCEQNIEVENPDTDGCDYIEELKELEEVTIQSTSSSGGGSSSRRTKLFWGFFMAALVVGSIIGCWVYAKRKKEKEETELSPSKENLI